MGAGNESLAPPLAQQRQHVVAAAEFVEDFDLALNPCRARRIGRTDDDEEAGGDERLPDLIVQIAGSGDFILVAEYLAQPRRNAEFLQCRRSAVALQRADQPLRPFAIAVDVAIADKGVVEVRWFPLLAGHAFQKSGWPQPQTISAVVSSAIARFVRPITPKRSLSGRDCRRWQRSARRTLRCGLRMWRLSSVHQNRTRVARFG